MNKKINTALAIAVIIIIAGTIGSVVYFKSGAKQEVTNQPIKKTVVENSDSNTEQKNETKNLQTYKNDQIGFELSYPANWKTIKLEGSIEKAIMGFTPINLDGYPTCIDYIKGLKNTPNEEQSEYFARTMYCIVNVIVDNNPKELSLADYLQNTYDKSKEHVEEIRALKIVKLGNGVETTKTKTFSFLRTGGFDGSADDPSFIGAYEQFIFKKGKSIVFITNKVNDEVGKNDNSFEKIISAIKFE